MRGGKIRRTGEGNGGAIGCLVVVVLIIGGLFLYQREGGKVFGPEGLAGKVADEAKQTRVVESFNGYDGDVGGVSYVEFSNAGADALSQINATVFVRFEDASTVELRQQWPHWEPGERKRINLASKSPVQDFELSGTASLRGRQVLCRAKFGGTPIRFNLKKDEGSFSHDVICAYKGSIEIREVDATVTVYHENGTKPQFKRYWASLRPGEERKVNIPAIGRIQRVDLAGSALVNGKRETFSLLTEW